jgi:hypothetical protein
MKYEELPPISRDELRSALASSKSHEAARALLRMALNEPDAAWAERKCKEELGDGRDDVRGAAITCLGHLARIHHTLFDATIVDELRKLQGNPKLGGIVEDALDDILAFASVPARSH